MDYTLTYILHESSLAIPTWTRGRWRPTNALRLWTIMVFRTTAQLQLQVFEMGSHRLRLLSWDCHSSINVKGKCNCICDEFKVALKEVDLSSCSRFFVKWTRKAINASQLGKAPPFAIFCVCMSYLLFSTVGRCAQTLESKGLLERLPELKDSALLASTCLPARCREALVRNWNSRADCMGFGRRQRERGNDAHLAWRWRGASASVDSIAFQM